MSNRVTGGRGARITDRDHTSNLPDWPGADSVYRRLQAAAREMGKREYAAYCRLAPAVQRGRKFSVSVDVLEICGALARGDEEQCKALLAMYQV